MAPVGKVPAAIPTTYIESGTVASEMSGASVAPTIEPVAKITAEFAPVSACAAARRTTLDRARASSETSAIVVTSIIGHFRPDTAGYVQGRIDSRYHGASHLGNQPMQMGARHARPFGRPCRQSFR